MGTLVVYDTKFGSTRKVAERIAQTLNGKALNVSQVNNDILNNINFLIIGSPTHGGRPTPQIDNFITNFPQEILKKIQFASFDTRFELKDLGFLLKLLVKTIGYASEKISNKLAGYGAEVVGKPQGFYVERNEKSLKKGELDRVILWSKKIALLIRELLELFLKFFKLFVKIFKFDCRG